MPQSENLYGRRAAWFEVASATRVMVRLSSICTFVRGGSDGIRMQRGLQSITSMSYMIACPCDSEYTVYIYVVHVAACRRRSL